LERYPSSFKRPSEFLKHINSAEIAELVMRKYEITPEEAPENLSEELLEVYVRAGLKSLSSDRVMKLLRDGKYKLGKACLKRCPFKMEWTDLLLLSGYRYMYRMLEKDEEIVRREDEKCDTRFLMRLLEHDEEIVRLLMDPQICDQVISAKRGEKKEYTFYISVIGSVAVYFDQCELMKHILGGDEENMFMYIHQWFLESRTKRMAGIISSDDRCEPGLLQQQLMEMYAWYDKNLKYELMCVIMGKGRRRNVAKGLLFILRCDRVTLEDVKELFEKVPDLVIGYDVYIDCVRS